MIIKIDTRESELLTCCKTLVESIPKYKDVKIQSITLPIGDVIINDGENDCVIIERKTLKDLAASIKDGRYEEQSYRLNGLDHPNHNIIYLIEGDMYTFNSFKDRLDKQTLYSAMFSINYFKGFSLMRSKDVQETASIVCNMVYKLVSSLKLGKSAYYKTNASISCAATTAATAVTAATATDSFESSSGNGNMVCEEVSSKDYCTVVKKVKKENITTDNIGEIMLCQIPGVSSASALAILTQFKTMANLIKCIQEDETCLNSVCTTDANGKNRKISKTTIATIVSFLKN